MQEEFRFELFEARLAQAGLLLNAAEVHGVLCGMVAGQKIPTLKELQAIFFKDRDQLGHGESIVIEHLQKEIELLVGVFDKGGFDFSPLLPDDDEELAYRLQMIGDWCHGFLNGLGRAEETFTVMLENEDLRDALFGLKEISEVSEINDDDEDSEKAYTILVEHLRVATILIHDELKIAVAPPSALRPQSTTNVTLH